MQTHPSQMFEAQEAPSSDGRKPVRAQAVPWAGCWPGQDGLLGGGVGGGASLTLTQTPRQHLIKDRRVQGGPTSSHVTLNT